MIPSKNDVRLYNEDHVPKNDDGRDLGDQMYIVFICHIPRKLTNTLLPNPYDHHDITILLYTYKYRIIRLDTIDVSTVDPITLPLDATRLSSPLISSMSLFTVELCIVP